jgi:hypothetical protein
MLEEDRFSTPTGDANGTGAARWILLQGGLCRSKPGAHLDGDPVMKELRAASRRSARIIQRLVRNHPDIEQLAGPTLGTIRLASCCCRTAASRRYSGSTARCAVTPPPTTPEMAGSPA